MKYKLKPGINECTNREYHGDTSYFSSSSLKLLLKDTEEFYKQYVLGERENKSLAAFDEGTYAHSLILEPETVDEEFSFYPGWRKQGKEWEQFKEGHGDKIILSKPQKVRVERWVQAYRERPEAVNLVEGGYPEHTIAGNLMGVPVKVRADYINIDRGYIADVKTTGADTDIDSFRYTIDNFSYQLSAALYCMMFEQHYNKSFDFYFIVLGKRNNLCEVYKTSKETMAEGKEMVSKALGIYKRCVKSGDWSNGIKKHDVESDGDYEILEV